MNLGWWTGTVRYPEAAEALARMVGQAARLQRGDAVVDIGCGAGDSTALWVRAFNVAQVMAIEPQPIVAARARTRVSAWQLDDRITIQTVTAESCEDTSALGRANAIVAVDAAYHIATRAGWLQRLGALCRPGTRFGSFDIALRRAEDRDRFARQAHRAGIPSANLWTVEEIVPTLATAGFTNVVIRHADAEVFAGFVRFVRRHAMTLAMHPHRGGWRTLGTALMLASAADRLTAVVIGAERSKEMPVATSQYFSTT